MNNDNSSCGKREGAQEVANGLAEVGGGVEGGLEVCRELNGGIRVWWRREKRRDGEFMEMDVGERKRVPPVDAELGLADVGGATHVEDGDVVGRDEAREVEELVEVALRRKRHHHHRDLGLF